MELELIVSQVLPQVKGQSARGEWVRQEVIFEYPDDNFGRKVCVSFWNDRAARAAALNPGERMLISANVESREHNGRWFTEVRGWRIDNPRPAAAPAQGQQYGAPAQAPAQNNPYPAYSNATAVPQQTAQAAATTSVASEPEGADDLPF